MGISYKIKHTTEKVLFHQKLESIQHNSALAIAGTIRRTSTEKLYNELGLETYGKKDGTKNQALGGNVVRKLILSNVHCFISLQIDPPDRVLQRN